jgi:hypothetical protein
VSANFKVERESVKSEEETGVELPATPEAAESGGGGGGGEEGSMDLNEAKLIPY